MAASLIIEEQHGTYTRRSRRHNGYYAGDFNGPLEAGVRRAGAHRTNAWGASTSTTLPAALSAAHREWA